MKQVLKALSQTEGQQPGRALVDVMFGNRAPRFVEKPPAWTPFNRGLDSTQVAAVSLALSAQDVALIHGPPGADLAQLSMCFMCHVCAYDWVPCKETTFECVLLHSISECMLMVPFRRICCSSSLSQLHCCH